MMFLSFKSLVICLTVSYRSVAHSYIVHVFDIIKFSAALK